MELGEATGLRGAISAGILAVLLVVATCTMGQSQAAGQTGSAAATQSALDNPVIDQVGGEEVITYLKSQVAFKYRYDAFDGGVDSNVFKLRWQQAFGPRQRLAVAVQLPFVYVNEPGNRSEGGLGDMSVEFGGMIYKGEKFEHAAGIEVKMPTNTSLALDSGDTVLRFVWGFTGQLTSKTLLSGEIAYIKAVTTQEAGPGFNAIEPELILNQALAKRVGAYLDWDNYYEFNIHKYINTMKLGLEIALDKEEKWGLAPYVVAPLSHASSSFETKLGAGVDLKYAF